MVGEKEYGPLVGFDPFQAAYPDVIAQTQQAAKQGLPELEVRVTLAYGEEVPYPWSAELWPGSPGETVGLEDVLEGELGIPRKRQVWHAYAEG